MEMKQDIGVLLDANIAIESELEEWRWKCGPRITELEARLSEMEAALESLKERAERVVEGEDWDLAEYILRKYGEVFAE
jgi:prefoldin subunit 5